MGQWVRTAISTTMVSIPAVTLQSFCAFCDPEQTIKYGAFRVTLEMENDARSPRRVQLSTGVGKARKQSR